MTRLAWQTPPGARPNREQSRSGSLRLPGRLLEAASNRRPRGMIAASASSDALEQNPAYRPSSGIFCSAELKAERETRKSALAQPHFVLETKTPRR